MVEPVPTHNRFAERLRAGDAALAIVDGQCGLLARAGETGTLRNNLMGLARLGHAFALPAVLGSLLSAESLGSVLDELVALFGAEAVFQRRVADFWDDRASRDAVLAHNRHHLILASLTPDFGVVATALGAQRDGLEVHVVLDASAGFDEPAERVGLARMAAAGIRITSWVAVLAELAATGRDTSGGNGAAAVRDNLDRYAASVAVNPTRWAETLALPR